MDFLEKFSGIVKDYWFLFLFTLFVGYLVKSIENVSKAVIFKICKHAYWGLILSLLGVFVTLYILISFIEPKESSNFISQITDIGNYIQIVTLVFAVFAGYYAFAQLANIEFNSLVKNGEQQLGLERYNRALELFQKALDKQEDFYVRANLSECACIVGDKKLLSESLSLLRPVEVYDKLVLCYLRISKAALENDYVSAHQEMKSLILLGKENKRLIDHFYWSFKDIWQSGFINTLPTDFQEIYNDIFSYLAKRDAVPPFGNDGGQTDPKLLIENKYST